jgi:hypothetical protein
MGGACEQKISLIEESASIIFSTLAIAATELFKKLRNFLRSPQIMIPDNLQY